MWFQNIKTKEVYGKAVSQNPYVLQDQDSKDVRRGRYFQPHDAEAFPDQFITQDMCDKAVEGESYTLQYILDQVETKTCAIKLLIRISTDSF